MDNKDVVITPQMRVPEGSIISSKPCYLITLKKQDKTPARRFLALDLPNMAHPAFAQMKGFFIEQDEAFVVANFRQMVQEMGKEKIVEIYLPSSSVDFIQNLVFRAK